MWSQAPPSIAQARLLSTEGARQESKSRAQPWDKTCLIDAPALHSGSRGQMWSQAPPSAAQARFPNNEGNCTAVHICAQMLHQWLSPRWEGDERVRSVSWERDARASAGFLMHNWYALLDHLPSAWIRWSGKPLQAASVAAPMWKLWLEKFPNMPAAENSCQSQSVRSTRDRGQPYCSIKRESGAFPRRKR